MKKAILAEFEHEAASTRKMLERVPVEKITWAPHDKSMTLDKIARHITNLPLWITTTLTTDERDFATTPSPAVPAYNSGEELAKHFDKNVADAKAALENVNEEDFEKLYVLRAGEKVFYNEPKGRIIRNFALNHMVHHRGQLSVYLRLLDVPVPGMYGPSADEARPA